MAASTLRIDFGTAGNSGDYEMSGWGRHETGCTWTVAMHAELRLPRPVAVDHMLHVSYRVFLPERLPWQRVRVRVGKEIVGRFVARCDGEITLWIPQGALKKADDPMVVTFDLVDAAKPPNSKPRDRTVLALALREAVLEPLTPALAPDILAVAKSCESIGRNCEFGLVQRYCQAEPISLLRWSGAPMSGLIEGLRHEFAGLMETASGEGSPRMLPREKQKFWWLTCDRYQIQFHTAENFQQCSVEQAAKNVRRRLRWLAGKLLEDIRGGEKVFVYSSADISNIEDAKPLVDAFRACGGTGPLVIVGEGPTEALQQAGENLWFARLPHLTAQGSAAQTDIGAWLPVMEAMAAVTSTLPRQAEPQLA